MTRAPARASAPSRVASATSLASRRSSPNPARAIPSISRTVAQVNPVWPGCRLAGRQRGALVRLDVRPQPVSGQRLRPWCGGCASSRPRVHEERRRRQLRVSSYPARYRPSLRRGRGAAEYSPRVSAPWLGDACSLVEAFRARDAVASGGPRRLHRRHRGVAAQRLQLHRLRPGPGGSTPGRRLAALRGRALRHQGAREGGGVAVYGGIHDLPGPGRRPRRHVALPPARQRCRAGGPDDGPRVRRASTAPRPSCTGRRATRGTPSAPRADLRVARRPRSPAGSSRSPPAATAAGPSGDRRASAGCSASRRPTGGSRRAPTAPSNR